MPEKNKIDDFFNFDAFQSAKPASQNSVSKHSRYVKLAKLLLPSIAALLLGTLLVFPSLKKDNRDIKLNITLPKQGELEKLHVENTVFYITDKDNKVNNFVAENIDETEPGSKLIKLTKPEGLLPLNETDWSSVKAPLGYYNQNTNVITLTDTVEIFYSEGMSLSTQEASFDFNVERGFGRSKVIADGYFGHLVADGFEFSTKDDILIFTGHSDITIKEESLKGR